MIDSEEIVEARHALGRQLAGHRQAAGYNQTSFAPLTAYSRSTIANVETGRQQVSREFWQRCDEVLGTNGALTAGYDEIRTAVRRWREQQARAAKFEREAKLRQCQALDGPGRRHEGSGEEDATDRRDAAKLIGLALAAAMRPSTLEAIEDSTASRPKEQVDRRLVAAHQQVAEALAGLYRGADPRSALPVTMAYADQVLELLDGTMGDQERAELAAIVVGVHAQVGLWACHMRRGALAYRYLATACEVAAGVDDRPLRARALGALSYLFSSAPRGGHGGNPRRSLALLDEALELAACADGFTTGWLATWRADQHATLGNLAAARADIATADHGLSSLDDGQVSGFFARPTYGYGFDGHMVRLRTMVLALGGEQVDLDRSSSEVLTSTANLRHRVCALANLAVISTAADEPERACHVLGQSVSAAAREKYAMGLERAAGVRSGFDPIWSTLPCVRDLDEQLRQLRRRRSGRERSRGRQAV